MTGNTIRTLFGAAALSALHVAPAPVLAQSPTLAWETPAEFDNPESTLYDANAGVIYVSNVNGSPVDKDGNGYIGKVSPDGTIIAHKWVTGLDAPKGLAMHGGKLYASNITELVEIDIASGEITNRYPGDGAKFLNDVTTDATGNVYVSDMVASTIHRLSNGKFELWSDDADLDNPNGLLAERDRIVVGAWGKMTDGFATAVPGHLKTVSISTGEVHSLGSGTPVGNLDGVEPDGAGNYYVSDWVAGKVFHVTPAGDATMLLDLGQGSADIGIIPEQALLLVPLMKENKVVAYQLR